MAVGFAGLSHLGIVSSIVTASQGDEVVAYDPDPDRVRELEAGRLPIVEHGLAELLALSRSRLRWTHRPESLEACDVVFCSADVPTTSEYRSDLSAIAQVTETVVSVTTPETILVVLSQVPPGWTRRLTEELLRQQPTRQRQVFYQAETLILGRAVERALRPERVIVGCGDPTGELPRAYATWLDGFQCPVLRMRYESAELAKIAVNLFLTSSVCTTNTLAEMCEALGAEWSEIVPALRLDRRIGPDAYLTPGLGLSGGNLERDLMTLAVLAEAHGTEAGLVKAWLADSGYRRDWVLRQLHAMVLSTTPEAVIAVLGLAYKAGTASTKHAPAMALMEALRPYRVQSYDPVVSLKSADYPHVMQSPSALEACRGADALAIMAPWPEFSTLPLTQVRELMRGAVILDPFSVWDHAQCLELGFRHVRLGTSAQREQVAAVGQGGAA